MVRELHRAGIEVILDVVYNHTGEGAMPRLSAFRGGRGVYYPGAEGRLHRATRTAANAQYRPLRTRDLVYRACCAAWAEEMHVDGFPLTRRQRYFAEWRRGFSPRIARCDRG